MLESPEPIPVHFRDFEKRKQVAANVRYFVAVEVQPRMAPPASRLRFPSTIRQSLDRNRDAAGCPVVLVSLRGDQSMLGEPVA
jgi:hypothetical protein